jgi:hypothetical protein
MKKLVATLALTPALSPEERGNRPAFSVLNTCSDPCSISTQSPYRQIEERPDSSIGDSMLSLSSGERAGVRASV